MYKIFALSMSIVVPTYAMVTGDDRDDDVLSEMPARFIADSSQFIQHSGEDKLHNVSLKCYESIEKILTHYSISMDSIPPINASNESLELIRKIFNTEDFAQMEIWRLESDLKTEELNCLREFKLVEKHLSEAEHNKYDREKVFQFITKYKREMAAFKKTDASLDMKGKINSIHSIRHDV